ncbi:hypothetical protein [Spiroplasma poulsonii]|uniref:hypothetical protein n=1 Tax=Spiroplasma poulsonii TaxID=2138 RepID=UPI001F543614|nr:hypothetical protein [Spiroplasma poulsonii]
MKEELQQKALELSSQALRVLAFAFKEYDKKEIETDLILLGCCWDDWPASSRSGWGS